MKKGVDSQDKAHCFLHFLFLILFKEMEEKNKSAVASFIGVCFWFFVFYLGGGDSKKEVSHIFEKINPFPWQLNQWRSSFTSSVRHEKHFLCWIKSHHSLSSPLTRTKLFSTLLATNLKMTMVILCCSTKLPHQIPLQSASSTPNTLLLLTAGVLKCGV